MSKLVFFIGPSGAGKSRICCDLETKHNDFKRIKLDDYEKDSNPNLGIKEIVRIEKSKSPVVFLIDVGAFFQKHIPENFWLERKDKLITIYNKPETCYERYKNRRTLKPRMVYEEYLGKEYNLKRKSLYELSKFKIITDEEICLSAKKAYEFTKQILNT